MKKSYNRKGDEKRIRLGFCPTMEKYAQQIGILDENIGLFLFGSAAGALKALNYDDIDIVFIGRIAKKNEIRANTKEIRLGEGCTLISDQKRLIDYQNLANMNIHTALYEKEAKNIISDNANIIYYKTLQEAIDNGIHEAVLINWNDYKDEYELLIPTENGGKVELFRTPVLYFNNLDENYIHNLVKDFMIK
ncbi:MAG: hypothetical protein DRG33_01930 [Deltaproteobacteria bacterium]|nr:MAG: hypothetical protein DRG33_01930 [Deltaproteobacteria bacterium]